MKRFISFCLILLIFLSNNSITVFANSNAETDVINQKIEKLKVKQKATEEHYSKALEKIDIAIDQYQDTFNNKSEKYKSINELKVRKTIKTAKRKKLKIISLVNDKLKEDLKKDITAELGITASLVEPNYLFELQGTNTTNDPAFNKQWGLKNILGNQAYAPLVYDGEKVTVAVIDTGIDFSSTDLQQTKWKRKICYDENNKKIPEGCLNGGYDFVDNDTNPYPSDNFTHGTSVASVIAAQTNNSANMSSIANNNIEIMSLRACCGATSFFGADNIAKSIYFAANNDAKIINASFGGPSHSKVIEDAIKYAQDKGVIVVAAAGNYSSNNDIIPLYPANYDLDNIISVAAINQGEFLSHFSNYGTNSVDITAPGENVTVLNGVNTLGTINGTSFSAPFVTSTLARYLSQNPDLTSQEAIQKIYSHSKENAKLYNIKNSLQLQLDPNSFSTSAETPVLPPVEPEPIDPVVPPVNPDPIDAPSGNSQELKEDYSKIMQEIALIRQGRISLQKEKKNISVQEVETLESKFQDFLNTETKYLQTRSDITETQKQKYLSFLETQLTLVQQFNASYKTAINTGNDTQSTITQQSFKNISEDIFKELNLEKNSEGEVKILPNMSQFSFGDTNEVVEKVENVKLIQNKEDRNNSDISAQSFVDGYIPQSTVAVNIKDIQDSGQVIINETIENLAAQLEYNPTKIYNYVRNNISYEVYYGSKRSSISCLEEGACNDIDQANLTLALLRASGIPARYKTNHIVVHKDKINQLFGVNDLKLSFHALLNAQVPTYRVNTTNNTGGKIKFSDIDFSQDEYIGLEWTNVEALIEYSHLAGNYTNELFLKGITDQSELNNKITEQGNLEWITIDPTFTFSEVEQITTQSKDLLNESGLDLDKFYLDYLKSSQNTDVIQKLQSDFQTNTPNLKNLSATALEDEYKKYFYSKTQKQSQFEIIPVSQYYVSGEFTLSDGTLVGETISSTLNDKKVQKLQVEIKRESNNEVVLDYIYSVDEINNSPLTLDYFGTTQVDRTTIENYGSIHLTPSDLVNLSLSIDTDATPHIQPLPTKSVKIGETLIMNFHYIVDGEVGNTSAKYTLGGNSEGIYMTFGKVSDDSLDTDSKVLLVGNWAIAKRYLQKIESASETLEKTLNIQNDIHYARAVVTQNRVLNTINGTPSTFEFKGLTLDANTLVKDYARSNYADNTLRTRLFRKIFGLYSSEQEGQIFNEITGLTGISTTKGLQYAYEHPAEYTIHTINSANKAVIDSLGYSTNTKTAMKKYVDEGRTIITPDKFVQNKNWKGMFYIAVNSIGEAVYAIGERVVQNGGYTTDELTSVGTGGKETAVTCNQNSGIYSLGQDSCKFTFYPASNISCISDDFMGKIESNVLTNASTSYGWNKSVHGQIQGKVSYPANDIVFTEKYIKFTGKPYSLSTGNYNYWRSCGEIKARFQDYAKNVKNSPIPSTKKYKFSVPLGTIKINHQGLSRGLYYSPDTKGGSVYSVNDRTGTPRFFHDVDQPYKKGTTTKLIQVLGYPLGDVENKTTSYSNGKTYTYKQQKFVNGYLFGTTGNITWGSAKFVSSDIAKYWENNQSQLGIPNNANAADGDTKVTQSFVNDRLVVKNKSTGVITNIEDGGYKCVVGNNAKIKNKFALYGIGIHGFIDELGSLFEIANLVPELPSLAKKAAELSYTWQSKKFFEVMNGEFFMDDIQELYDLVRSIKKEEAEAFLDLAGNAAKKKSYKEFASEANYCPARHAYIAGRMDGIIAESIVAVVGVASKARAIEGVKNIKGINKLLKNIRKDKSSANLNTKINKVLDNPCFRKSIGSKLQSSGNSCIYVPNPREKVERKINHIYRIELDEGIFKGVHHRNALMSFKGDVEVTINGNILRKDINGKWKDINGKYFYENGFIGDTNFAKGQKNIPYKIDQIRVKENGGNWITKSGGGGGSTFFPDNWTKHKIIEEVTNIVENNKGKRFPNNQRSNEYYGTTEDGVNISFYLSRDRNIISYFTIVN